MGTDPEREELAAAIKRADHHCLECQYPLGGPVLDEFEWIPDSQHWFWCPALIAGSDAMILAWLDVLDALHSAGYGADYGNPVSRFSGAVAA